MSGLENLLGGTPIAQLPNNLLPTLRHVLLLYSNFWKKEGSDSLKEKIVAQELIRVYERLNIPVLSELTIKNKIKRSIAELKKVLKFQTKSKTVDNVRVENNFVTKLGDIFDISRSPEEFEENFSNEPMDTDDLNGIVTRISVQSAFFQK